VFIHGFPFHAGMWDGQLDRLPEGWRGLAPDLRGFGGSKGELGSGEVATGKRVGGRIAGPDEAVLTMARAADDIAGVIEAEWDGPAVVCGLSMGGYVALELVRRRPDLVRALVLSDTRASADTDEGRENRMRMAQTARASGPEPIATAMIPDLLADTTLEEGPEVADFVKDMILDSPPASLVAALAGMAARHDFRGDLRTIDRPTLVIVGEQDRITPPESARVLVDGIPGARLEIIPYAGHLSNLENPEAFDRALAGFLETLGDQGEAVSTPAERTG
jgi:3-oxoadipate enol-lactonase